MRFALQDYSDILFSGYNYKLPDNVDVIIARLIKEFGASVPEKTDVLDNDGEQAPRFINNHFFLGFCMLS